MVSETVRSVKAENCRRKFVRRPLTARRFSVATQQFSESPLTSPPLSGSFRLLKGKIQSDAHPINYVCKFAFCWGLVGVCRGKTWIFTRRVGFFCPRSPLQFSPLRVIMPLKGTNNLCCREIRQESKRVYAPRRGRRPKSRKGGQ